MARQLHGHDHDHDAEVHRITTLPESKAADIARRQKRYVISMAIRTLCFVGAIIADGWLRWVLVAAAFLLPYFAVVMANAAAPRVDAPDIEGPGVDPRHNPELEGPRE